MELAVSSLPPCQRPRQMRIRCAARTVATGHEPPQISMLREKVQTCEKRAAIVKLECETAHRQLEEHLSGLNSLKDAVVAQPIWLVTQIYDQQYDDKRFQCRGAFNNKGDALLRRDFYKSVLKMQSMMTWSTMWCVSMSIRQTQPMTLIWRTILWTHQPSSAITYTATGLGWKASHTSTLTDTGTLHRLVVDSQLECYSMLLHHQSF